MKKWIVVWIVLLLTGCTTSPTGRSQLMLMSPQKAISASADAYVETLKPLQKAGKVDSDPVLSKRIRRITGKLIAQAISIYPHTRNWDWSIKVLDDPKTVNAWCMAGGKMAIYTGLIRKIKPSDDEIAQVMGHEIAHALANHTAEKMSVAMATSIGVMAVGILAKDEQKKLALSGASLAAVLALKLPNSRTAESEADEIGLELAARAGYDPAAAVSLWQKMERVSGKGKLEFLSTHPSSQTRIKKLSALIPKVRHWYLDKSPRPVYSFRTGQ